MSNKSGSMWPFCLNLSVPERMVRFFHLVVREDARLVALHVAKRYFARSPQ
jgi:hypothetical protein